MVKLYCDDGDNCCLTLSLMCVGSTKVFTRLSGVWSQTQRQLKSWASHPLALFVVHSKISFLIRSYRLLFVMIALVDVKVGQRRVAVVTFKLQATREHQIN